MMASDTAVAVGTANVMPEFQYAEFCFLRTFHFKTDTPRIPSHSFSLLHACAPPTLKSTVVTSEQQTNADGMF